MASSSRRMKSSSPAPPRRDGLLTKTNPCAIDAPRQSPASLRSSATSGLTLLGDNCHRIRSYVCDVGIDLHHVRGRRQTVFHSAGIWSPPMKSSLRYALLALAVILS